MIPQTHMIKSTSYKPWRDFEDTYELHRTWGNVWVMVWERVYSRVWDNIMDQVAEDLENQKGKRW